VSFFALSVLVYAGLTFWLSSRVDGTTTEWGYTLVHLVVAAAINAHLLSVARRRQLSFLGSAALGLLLLNQIYFTVNGLKYFSPILLYPQFDLDLRNQFLGSLAGAAVLAVAARLLLAQRGPRSESLRAWIQWHWPDVRRLMVASVIGSTAAKVALVLLGYGSSYTETQYYEHAVRSYGDYFILLANDTLGGLSLIFGMMYLMRPAGWDRRRPIAWLIAVVGVLLHLGYGVLYLKARAVLLVSVVMFALASEVASRKRAATVLKAMFICLPVLSLLGLQLTLLIGRINVPEEAGLRLAIGAINRRADITDFATAMVVQSKGQAYDPTIVPESVLNAIPRLLFPDKDAVVRDVYSDILEQKLGWPRGSGPDMTADYQDSMFSAGTMSFGTVGFVLLPLMLVWLYGLLSRFLERWLRGPAYGLALIAFTQTAIHIEVEWAAIPLNVRQALSTAILGLVLVGLARMLRQVLLVATWTPPLSAGGEHAVRLPGRT
jgi:hypothetical protein